MARRNDPLAEVVEDLEGDGLSLDIVAASVRRVFSLVTTGKEPEEIVDEDDMPPGWKKVAERAGAMYAESGEEDVSLSVPQFADMLRVAFARAENEEFDGPSFDELPAQVRAGWMYAARHAANLFNMDSAEARRLGQHEDRMAGMGREFLSKSAAA